MTNENALSVQTEHAEQAVIVCPVGRVDGSSVGVLESAIQELLDAGEQTLIFDCAGLQYINSGGLRVLLVTARRTQAEGGKALFCGLAEPIAHVFEISGFTKILTICQSRSEALAAL